MFTTLIIIILAMAAVSILLLAAGMYIDMRAVTDENWRAKRDMMIDLLSK